MRCGAWSRMMMLLSLCCLGGCILYEGERRPNLVATGAEPVVTKAPRIEVILRHRHTIDGADGGGMATEMTLEQMREAYARVQQSTPFLANAASGVAKPDLVLDLDTEVAEHGKTGAIVSGATLGIIPAFISSDVIVRATLKDPQGETLGTYEAVGQVKGVFQILLLPALPALPFTAPGDELYDDTFRDVMIQLAPVIEESIEHP